ncbi:hypothetical protein ABZX51_008368 [Aspergillus tubingensis]
MVYFPVALISLVAAGAGLVSAHPGHDMRAEVKARAEYRQRTPVEKRSLSHCSKSLGNRGVDRRSNMVKEIRRQRGLSSDMLLLKGRSFESALNTSHHSDLTGLTQYYNPEYLFASNATCALAEDTTEGPYYVSGEYVRSNIAEQQAGVPLWLDIQLINTNTCEPEPEVFMDIWHCNATGVYSGVSASGNGNGGDANLDTTFLRGIQRSDENGVVQFQTIFPGHYTGRATHIHVLTHYANETVELANGTVSGLYSTQSSHIGQLFFDQDLISQVEALIPYTTNTQELTTNANDDILEGEADDIDPFMEYVMLGDSVSDGIFAWIQVAIDPTSNRELSPAAYFTADGGVENDDSSMGGTTSGAAPSSTMAPQ